MDTQSLTYRHGYTVTHTCMVHIKGTPWGKSKTNYRTGPVFKKIYISVSSMYQAHIRTLSHMYTLLHIHMYTETYTHAHTILSA